MRRFIRRRSVGWEINPFEAYLLLAAEIQGVTVLLGLAQPGSVRQALPALAVYAWAAILAFGGGAALVGLFWPGDPFTGVEIKRVGLVACGGGSLVYALSAAILGPPGLAVAIYNALFAFACIVRARQVSNRLALARAHMSETRSPPGERGG